MHSLGIKTLGSSLLSSPTVSTNGEIGSSKSDYAPSPSYNTALYPNWKSSPIVSIEGLLRLVALVAQYRATLGWNTQGGAACQSDPSPPPQALVLPHLWGQLPSNQQQRLVAVLSQMMMAQIALLEQKEDSYDC